MFLNAFIINTLFQYLPIWLPHPKNKQKKQTNSVFYCFVPFVSPWFFYMERCKCNPVTFQPPNKPHGWTWGSDRCVAPYALALAFIDWGPRCPKGNEKVHITPAVKGKSSP